MLGFFSFSEKDPQRITEFVWEFLTNLIPKENLKIKINKNDLLGIKTWERINKENIELIETLEMKAFRQCIILSLQCWSSTNHMAALRKLQSLSKN